MFLWIYRLQYSSFKKTKYASTIKPYTLASSEIRLNTRVEKTGFVMNGNEKII